MVTSKHPNPSERKARRLFLVSGVCAFAGTALLVAAVVGPRVAHRRSATEVAASSATGSQAAPRDDEAWTARPAVLSLGEKSFERAWGDLGVTTSDGARVDVDPAKARQALLEIKGHVDTLPTDAMLDLERRVIVPEQNGFVLDVEGSLVALTLAARRMEGAVTLAGKAMPPSVTTSTLGISDISHVLASYKTNFSVSDRDRNFNLKLAASHLHGLVIAPGQQISFNEVVGDRTEKTGYRVAHVISAGEMVDGLAGGTCQISTTLFGAAFFAGLDIVNTTTHSRPLAYAPMGMDATVTYPHIDLKLKNPYEFPVVIRYRVANGEALVEILGKQRPYEKIVFERDIIDQVPYEKQTRDDPMLALGDKKLDQPGMNGYKLRRYRRFYQDGKVVKSNKWDITYQPVVEYVNVGTNPAKPPPTVAPPVEFEPAKPKNMATKIAH
ncbi:MAG: VanW family protein [Myxococcales bacterium]|nr:VanW family protein [Myxococcales bacterium]